MNAKFTPGPWYFDEVGNIWRRPPSELYQNGGGVAGDRSLATTHEGWYGEDVAKYPRAANARLIAAAPELLEALTVAREWMRGDKWRNSTVEKHAAWEAVMRGIDAAIAKATGENA